ncbi:conjugative transposon protein TraM [Fulvivirga ligni]|uniref:conjugative transposon protein TraM n=1 Tax=Fulvivirga ligni TaxID=2904246 RepID=UPI001F1E8D37|nr:conjugative transposon protein TraM [Fulvivirga ligni]UII20799.1 conjugative transposon protein TraM [Fulvivirga ligni]
MKSLTTHKNPRSLVILPLIILPFLVLLFWALGEKKNPNRSLFAGGLNLNLPEALVSDGDLWDKLNIYQISDRDSVKLQQKRKNDPYYPIVALSGDTITDQLINEITTRKADSVLQQQQQRLGKSLEVLEERTTFIPHSVARIELNEELNLEPEDPEIEKLELLMRQLQVQEEQDPEMQQIANLLDKVLDVQHPERVEHRMEKLRNEEDLGALPVVSAEFTKRSNQNRYNRFYGFSDENREETSFQPNLSAYIKEEQRLINGATVKLYLSHSMKVGEYLLNAGTPVFGECQLRGERLLIEIKGIYHKQNILPVALSVYDLDGIEGIYVPDAIGRQVVQRSSQDILNDIPEFGINQNTVAQMTTAGITTAQHMLGKKVKQTAVTLAQGYQVILVDRSQARSQLSFNQNPLL